MLAPRRYFDGTSVGQRDSRFALRVARSCHGSTSRAMATLAIQSSVGDVAAARTANTWERETPAKSARAVNATGFRRAAARMFRATSRRSVFASTRSTVEGVRHRGIRYPGLYSPHDWRPR
jgi:nucleoside-diphosphate-sugar epimerase